MKTNRKEYIVTFFKNSIPEKLAVMKEINLTYVSKKFKYAVFYCDKHKQKKDLIKDLSSTRGFLDLKEALLFDENCNIN